MKSAKFTKTNKLKGFHGIAEGIVKGKWVLIIIFLALTIAGCAMISQTQVKYDLSSYLAKGSDASVAMEVLKEEFDDKGMSYVVVKGISEERANEIKNDLSKMDGVASVTYMPDMNYKNGNAMFTVTLTDYDSTEKAFDTVENMMDSLKDEDAYFTGQSSNSYFTRTETEKSILKIGIVIVIAILLMLLFTSKSYFEILLMVIVFGVSVAINMGTNFLFNYASGGISYVSNLVSLVLQLALSIDYSVILLHRYMEERSICSDAKTAAVSALTKGIPEILSSSLTTIVGLCALMFMSLTIGVEIGIALAKGIVCSLVTVIFLMPALLVVFAKPLEKTKHKSFVPNVTRPARAIVRARKILVPVFLVIVVLAGTGQFYNKYSFNLNGSADIVSNREAVIDDFGTLNSLVVVVPKGDYEKQRELAAYVEAQPLIDSTTALATIEIADGIHLTDAFNRSEFVSVLGQMSAGTGFDTMVNAFAKDIFDSYTEENIPDATSQTKVPLIDLLEYAYNSKTYSNLLPADYKDMLGQLVFARTNLEGETYSRLTFNIAGEIEGDDTFALIETLKSGITDFYPDEFYMMGESVVCYDMSLYFPKDNLVVSLFTIIFILIILLFTFKNLALPVILILAIQGGIWINFVFPFLFGDSVSFIGYLIISAVQMGATIDYAIVLTNRYNSIKDGFPNKFEAMAAAENAVFPTIITSGIILTVTGFTLGLASSGVVAQLGSLLGVGTLASVLVVLFILPSMLLAFEKPIDKTFFKTLFKRVLKKKGGADDEPIDVSESELAVETCEPSADNYSSDVESLEKAETDN